MTKKITLLLIATLTSFTLNAQSVDEILDNYFENTGGKEAWKEMKSMKMEAMMSMQQMELPATIYSAEPNKQKVEINVQGKSLIQAYDGTTAWMINPFMGGDDPQKMPEEMSEDMVKEKFEDDFLDYKEKGHTVELLGKKEIEGAETFEIKLTKKSGDVEHHYFDTENFVPIMIQTIGTTGPTKGQASETYLSDYQEVGDFVVPFFMETKVAGQTIQKITVKNVELDVELADDFFDFPGMTEKGENTKDDAAAPTEAKEQMEKAKEMQKEKTGGN